MNVTTMKSLKTTRQAYFYGHCFEYKDAYEAAIQLQAMNHDREENNDPLITRMYLPLFCDGGVAHGILACIELNQKNVEITVIDSLGSSNYKKHAVRYVKEIQRVYKDSDVRVVYNKKRTQFDLNCGYHQILNTMHLNEIQNVQSYIENDHLPIITKEEVEAFYQDVLVPRVLMF